MKNAFLALMIGLTVGVFGISSFAGQNQSDLTQFSENMRSWGLLPNWGYQCNYVDAGWEEHRGGHDSCGECLSRHGKCIETCYEEYYECTVEGTDNSGQTREFSVRGSSQWRAEDDAMRRCYDLRYSDCESKGCNQEQEVISRRRCQ